MHLNTISLTKFRNYNESSFSFGKRINCITGSNGAGKTNLLDAIYYICITKSYFATTEFQNIKHGESWFVLRGEIELNGIPYVVKCKVEKEKRKDLYLNEKRYERLSDHIGLLPLVFSTPNDVELIYGGSEERRRFLDLMLSQTDHTYLENLQEYNRLLIQRNALLKQFAEKGNFNASLLEVYDSRMLQPSTYIHNTRKDAIKEILPHINETCHILSNGKEDMGITYQSDLHNQSMEQLLAGNLERDRIMKRTSSGIHRDDLIFRMDEKIIKRFASQGQQKSFLIALKVGLLRWLKERKQVSPFLLLDDIFDKLDSERSSLLIELIAQNEFGQVFLTDTQHQRLEKALGKTDGVKFFQM